MRPGETATCICCGAQVRAEWRSLERPWQEGWPVSVVWTHGPHPRWMVVVAEAPDLCAWCWERRQALGPDAAPLYRPAPGSPSSCFYLRDGRPTDGCRPTSACWTDACGAAGIARPPEPGANLTNCASSQVDASDATVTAAAPARRQLALF